MTLVVETGTGIANADAYISVADSVTYHANFGNSVWAELDEATREVLIRSATRALDLFYGKSYISTLLTTTQALLWPRVDTTDKNGVTVTGLPVAVAHATAELALLMLTNDVMSTDSDSGNIKEESTKLGDLETTISYWAPTDAGSRTLRKIALILQNVTASQSTGLYAQIARG